MPFLLEDVALHKDLMQADGLQPKACRGLYPRHLRLEVIEASKRSGKRNRGFTALSLPRLHCVSSRLLAFINLQMD